MPRAEWLGSAGLRALVRCACGVRLDLSLPHWRRRSFTACDRCRAVIRYGSLEVVNPLDVEEFVEMVIRQEEERAALLEDVERELRRFVRAYDGQPEWLWSPATQRLVRYVRPKLELLGGTIGPQDAGRAYSATQEGAYQAEDEGQLDEDAGGELDEDAA